MRHLALALLMLLAVVACGSHSRAPDAGAPEAATEFRSVAIAPVATVASYAGHLGGPRRSSRGRVVSYGHTNPRAAAHPKPTPAYVTACIAKKYDGGWDGPGEYLDAWGQLERCLKEAPPKPAVQDGGVHKLGDFLPPPVTNPAWDIPAWYVNASTGNDHNTCVTSGSPCKTHARIVDRWGTPCPGFTAVVQENILSDLPATDQIQVCSPQGVGGGYNVQGVTTTVSSGSLAGVVAKNRGANQVLNVDLGASAAGAVGLMVHNSSHPSNAWVRRIISGTVVEMGQPETPETLTSPLPNTEVDRWTNGDSFTVQRPPKLSFQSAAPVFQDAFTNGFTAANVWIQDNGTGASILQWSNAVLQESRVDIDVVMFGSTLSNVYSNPNNSGGGVAFAASANFAGGCVLDAVTFSTTSNAGVFSAEASDADILNDSIVPRINDFNEVAYDFLYSPGGTYTISEGAIMVDGVGGVGTGPAMVYGAPTINVVQDGRFVFPSTAASNLPGATLQIDGVAKGMAQDRAFDLSPSIPDLTLTPALLDATIASSGFDGVAYSIRGTPAFMYDSLPWVSPTAYFVPGTNITFTGCTPGHSCTISSTASGITGSGTIHDVAVWASSSSLGAVAGSTNGQPLLWISGSADPTFAALNLSGSGVTSTLGHANGGTDVTSPGANGNVLTSNGTNWTSAAPTLPAAAFVAGSTTVALGAGITTIASASLTVPSGKNIAISIAWQFDNPNPGADFNGMVYGYGLASGSYVRTGTVSIPMNNAARVDGVDDGFAAGAMQAQAASSGSSITVFAEATGNPDTAIGVNAQINLIETN